MRSTDAADYQDVPRPVAVMRKAFAPGAVTGRHRHRRAQLLYATSGIMTAGADEGSWLVPEGHALLIPPELDHEVAMHGAVVMLTAYLEGQARATQCRVLRVTPALDAVLAALADEPILYDAEGRPGLLAALALAEIARAPDAPFAMPLPPEPRLRAICRALIEDPAIGRDIDGWADAAGMSRRTLTRRFREETGLSFGEWRRRLRLLAAMTLGGRPDRRLAAAVGYDDPRALRAMMRRTLPAAVGAARPPRR